MPEACCRWCNMWYLGSREYLRRRADDRKDDIQLVRDVLETGVRRRGEGEAGAAREERALLRRGLVNAHVEQLGKDAAYAPDIDRVPIVSPAKNNLWSTVPPEEGGRKGEGERERVEE